MSLHDHGAHDVKIVACFVLTVSDTRTSKSDDSGRTLIEHLEGEGHKVVGYAIVKDNARKIESTVKQALRNTVAQAIFITGGTGISKRDVTVETVEAMFQKSLPGFGELFRQLSFQEIGSQALLSRATAGVLKSALVFCMPGSPKAVRLALDKLILPTLSHLVGELRKSG